MELSSDHAAILQVAQDEASQVSVSQLLTQLKWEEKRVRIALDLMMQGGMVWVDEQGGAKEGGRKGEKVYWFPSLWQQERVEAAGEGGGEGAGGETTS